MTSSHGHSQPRLIPRRPVHTSDDTEPIGGVSGDFNTFSRTRQSLNEDPAAEPLESQDLEDGIASPGAWEVPDEFDISEIVPPLPPMENDPLGLLDSPPRSTPPGTMPEAMPAFVPQPVDDSRFPGLVNDGYTTNLPDAQARSQAILSRIGALRANRDDDATPVNYTPIEVFRARVLARKPNQQEVLVASTTSDKQPGYASTSGPADPQKRGPGRPRKRPLSPPVAAINQEASRTNERKRQKRNN